MSLSTFDQFFSTAKQIAYNPEWENGTGYFNNAVIGDHAPSAENGDAFCSVDPSGRRIAILQTRLGNVVVFQRYTKFSLGIYVKNLPFSLFQLFKGTHFIDEAMTDDSEGMLFLLGNQKNGVPNAHQRLEAILNVLAETA